MPGTLTVIVGGDRTIRVGHSLMAITKYPNAKLRSPNFNTSQKLRMPFLTEK